MGKQQVIKSKHGMSAAEGMVHAVLIVCTAGLWLPVFLARKHAVDRTTTTYLG
jgi:hypothetical protein